MRLHTLSNRPGAKHRVKRLGQGRSSGHGKTSGRGGKGQTARTGSGIRPGFEGGQMPLIRRIPKRGFNNKEFRTEYAIVNVEHLNVFDDGAEVTPDVLIEKGLIRSLLDGLKVLGDGELKKKLTIKAHKFSVAAQDKISKAGGQCQVIEVIKRSHAPKPVPAPADKAKAQS
ncbi:MAG: 50S ribosomal protein L15 [Verrucomicrobiae bacterium]|nr:50S ribosomal protein L15 [Verrucomicrobiae bacterium]